MFYKSHPVFPVHDLVITDPAILILHQDRNIEVILHLLTKQVLGDVKFSIVQVEDGADAFEVLRHTQINKGKPNKPHNKVKAIFLDHHVSGINGMQFLIEKQKMASIKDVPSILMTHSWKAYSFIQAAIKLGHIAGLIRLPIEDMSVIDKIIYDLNRMLVSFEGRKMEEEMLKNRQDYLKDCNMDEIVKGNWLSKTSILEA